MFWIRDLIILDYLTKYPVISVYDEFKKSI